VIFKDEMVRQSARVTTEECEYSLEVEERLSYTGRRVEWL